ncbi:MAG: MopE-related protein [Chitinophagales bacterium]
MKINCLATVFFLLFAACSLFSQAPNIIWEHSYGGTKGDIAYKIKETPDKGFIIFGYSPSSDGDITENKGVSDYWVVKVDSNQNIEWQKTLGGSSYDYGRSGLIDYDGGVCIFGYSLSGDGDISAPLGANDFWLVKLNAEGDLIWERSYGGIGDEFGRSIILTEYGGYILAGASGFSDDHDVSGNHGSVDFWVVKLDASANIEWQKCYGGSEYDFAYSIEQTPDEGFIVAGKTESSDGDVSGYHGNVDYWVIKIDSIGNIEWEKAYGGTGYDVAYSVKNTIDGGFIIAGESDSNNGDVTGFHGGPTDFWVVKTDNSGNIEWQKTFGGTGGEEANVVIEVIDSGYLVAGYTGSNNMDVSGNHGGSDAWLVKISDIGELIWQKCLGGSLSEYAHDLIFTADNNIVLAGASSSSDGDVTENHGIADYWIVKLGFCTTHYYADADGDGFGDLLNDSVACNLPVGYVTDSTDCNDANNLIFPTAEDICNTVDDNCNGFIDEDAIFTAWYLDNDGDNFGDMFIDSISCFDLTGYVIDNTDCDDLNTEINPAAIEICNDIDDNCNFDIDEGLTITTFYIDADGDAFGNADIFINSCLEIIAGYVLDSTDCNDANNLIYPGAIEICDYLDNDCDGIVDDNLTLIHSFEDADEDNFGNINVDSLSCAIPDGFVEDDSDCDDTNPLIYPGADEILNGVDDNCNLLIDEGLGTDNILLSQITLYPNPTENILHLDYSGVELLMIEILNSDGQRMQTIGISSGENQIDIKNLAAGMYFLTLKTADNFSAIKFVKEVP